MSEYSGLLQSFIDNAEETYDTLNRGKYGKVARALIQGQMENLDKITRNQFPLITPESMRADPTGVLQAALGNTPISVLGTIAGYGTDKAKNIAERLNKTHGALLDADISGVRNKVTLDKLIVDKANRNKGIGSAFLNDLTGEADKNKLLLALDAMGDFGGNKARQNALYKRFGFVDNKGRNKDFSISQNMYRNPVEIAGLPETDFSKAHAIAQANAALPIEQGGLGLPANNTSMDRAKAMGYTFMMPVRRADRYYHIGSGDIPDLKGMAVKSKQDLKPILQYLSDNEIPYNFNRAATTKSGYLTVEGSPELIKREVRQGDPVMATDDFEYRFSDHPANMPMVRKGFFTKPEIDDAFIADVFPGGHDANLAMERLKTTPGLRSRLAAFDPFKKASSDILASGLIGSLLLNDEAGKKSNKQ